MNMFGHGEFIADADAGVEPVDCGNKFGEGSGGVLRGANDKEKGVTRILVDAQIDSGTEGVLSPPSRTSSTTPMT